MNDELHRALARFDGDVRLVCGASGGSLHRRVTDGYRQALATAAGLVDDAAWKFFVRELAALLAAVGEPRDLLARGAAERLRAIVSENGDLLDVAPSSLSLRLRLAYARSGLGMTS